MDEGGLTIKETLRDKQVLGFFWCRFQIRAFISSIKELFNNQKYSCTTLDWRDFEEKLISTFSLKLQGSSDEIEMQNNR